MSTLLITETLSLHSPLFTSYNYYYDCQNFLLFTFNYPVNFYLQYSEEQQAEIIFQEEDRIKRISEKYEIKTWLSVNSFVNMSLHEWLYLSNSLKKAIIREVKEIANEQEKEARARKQELESMKAQMNTNLKFQNLSPFIHNYTK